MEEYIPGEEPAPAEQIPEAEELIPSVETETDEDINSEDMQTDESVSAVSCAETAAADTETDENGNLTLCPNCLEPNPDGLAVCRYCGMPLHPGAENIGEAPADEESMAKNREEAVPAPEAEKDRKKEKEERGFHKYMPYLGLYIIYYAITGFYEVSHRDDIENPTLGYISYVVYLVAGILMAWPMIKKGWKKIHPSAEKPEEEEAAESETQEAEPSAEISEPEQDAEEPHEETPDEAA